MERELAAGTRPLLVNTREQDVSQKIELRRSARRAAALVVDLLHGDVEGGQRVIVARHRNLDRPRLAVIFP